MTETIARAPAVPAQERARPRLRVDLPLALVALLSLAVSLAVVVLDVRAVGRVLPPGVDGSPGWPIALSGLALLVPGLVVVRDRARHRVGLVLVVGGVAWVLDALAGAWLLEALVHDRPFGGLAFAVINRWGAFLLLTLPLILLLFPDGELPRGRWGRAASVASLAATALLPLCLVLVPTAVIDAHSGAPTAPEVLALGVDTLSVPWTGWPAVLTVAYAFLPLGLLVPLAVVVVRFRRATGVRRRQMRWLVWAAIVDALVMLVGRLLPAWASGPALCVAIAVTSAAILVAVTRYRLYEIDRLLPATVLTALLAVGVVAVDVLLVLTAGALLGDRDAGLIAVAVVAVAYTPLRTRLWTLSRRLVRGTRDDPEGTVAALAGRLESASAPDAQLAALARTVVEAFRLPGVRVEVDRADGARATVEHGRPGTAVVELPLRYRDEPIGRVALPAHALDALSARDQRLLADLLRQAAAAARAGALGASLQRAREQIVTAREEERRRLRRDLHDSVGPALGAVTLRIETARELAAADPVAADGMLDRATADVAALLADVRRLVHDLRPPALDELGLVGALRARARSLSGDGLEITVRGDDPGELSAAVEVAAFHIVSEALTNVVRHAHARTAEVVVTREPDRLVVTVADDGRGITPAVTAGVGSRSLRERSAELGGTTTVSCPDDGGTVVRAELPCAVTP
ncbi:sensor histidine kinase [Actinomycetospora termitidis]|uniref:histidine kinase n=1 Tax=Actinomycetospora termitidis TaxID=3053470 RepID=A0ABT7MD97_9PSEU|nr:sensor histidine kinase [Actinomycetospora sp. Odt1-22]MDL5158644.1 sensor histidine kinase [Actinomycetospora sp. Odt1-22]